jgi:hypothetical protein
LADYSIDRQWINNLPNTLVVMCSDGRFQQETDEFLHDYLGISRYDRLYVPGGAGALTASGFEFSRAGQIREECRFLIAAHGIERAILMFHGPSTNGPEAAICGDYRRVFPSHSAAAIYEQQVRDAAEIIGTGLEGVPVELYRCEVTEGGVVQFVEFSP